jgi:uncharacterized membrane protein
MQSVFLSGLALVFAVAIRVAHLVFDFIPWVGTILMLVLGLANMAFGLAWFVVYLISLVKAFSNQEWEIPWLGKLARAQLEKMDGPPTRPAA